MFTKAFSAAFSRRGFIVALSLLAVAAVAPARADTLTIFAAASLKNALDTANSLFLFENGSGVKVTTGQAQRSRDRPQTERRPTSSSPPISAG